MNLFSNLNLDLKKVLKIFGLAVGIVFVLLIVFTGMEYFYNMSRLASSGPAPDSYSVSNSVTKGYAPMAQESSLGLGFSARNAESFMPPVPGGTAGDTAENFEVKEYSATIETRNVKEDCPKIYDLKKLDYVIFENSSEYERGCNFTFKVKKEKVGEILTFLKNLKPKDFSESSYTIQNLVEDHTGRIDILKKKLAVVEDTLKKATESYDEVMAAAKETRSAEALANIINSKIITLERLTNERINISNELERIEKSKEKEMDRLLYSYFNVSVFESKFVDLRQMKDSWKFAVQRFFLDINNILQDSSITLVYFLALLVQIAIYGVILLLVAKYGWRFVKNIWNK